MYGKMGVVIEYEPEGNWLEIICTEYKKTFDDKITERRKKIFEEDNEEEIIKM